MCSSRESGNSTFIIDVFLVESGNIVHLNLMCCSVGSGNIVHLSLMCCSVGSGNIIVCFLGAGN